MGHFFPKIWRNFIQFTGHTGCIICQNTFALPAFHLFSAKTCPGKKKENVCYYLHFKQTFKAFSLNILSKVTALIVCNNDKMNQFIYDKFLSSNVGINTNINLNVFHIKEKIFFLWEWKDRLLRSLKSRACFWKTSYNFGSMSFRLQSFHLPTLSLLFIVAATSFYHQLARY